MAQDQVEEVKQKTDIISLISEFIDLKKAGRNYKALCPFHSEKTPSFMVSPELQIFKCFGCGESGDSYAFLQKYEGMDFAEALKFLAERAGVKLKPFASGKRSLSERLFQINTHAANFYHYLLLKHPVGSAALSYLIKERGLKPETLKEFRLGYSPSRPLALKSYLVDKKKISERELETAGLIFRREGKVFDRFAGRVVFPLHDHRGNISGFAGRILPGEAEGKVAKYINTPETPTYQKSRMLYGLNLVRADIKKAQDTVVVEGELDMISSWQAGIKNVVAIKGSALTPEQARLLRRFAEKVTLALDTDIAGDAAARRGISIAESEGLTVKVAVLSGFKDPDEAVRKDPTSFKKALEKPVPVWDFLIDQVFSRHSQKTGAGKGEISREIVPLLSAISDKIVQAHYVNLVAKKLSIPVTAVAAQVDASYVKGEKRPKVEAVVKPKGKSRRELLEERLMTLAFASDPKVLLEKNTFVLIKTPLAARILNEYKVFSRKARLFNPAEFAAALPRELVEGFAEMILKEIDLATGAEDLVNELRLVTHELQIVDVRQQLDATGEQIREYEEKGNRVKLKKAQKKFGELSQRLSRLEERD